MKVKKTFELNLARFYGCYVVLYVYYITFLKEFLFHKFFLCDPNICKSLMFCIVDLFLQNVLIVFFQHTDSILLLFLTFF